MTILVTGCAGFIGTNFVKYYLKKYPKRKIIGLDKLTYAGNLENLKEELENAARSELPVANSIEETKPQAKSYKLSAGNFTFIKGDLCDSELVNYIFDEYEIDGVINFAAESHVDRSIHDPQIFVKTNVLGTQVLLDATKKHWQLEDGKWKTISEQHVAGSTQNKNKINNAVQQSASNKQQEYSNKSANQPNCKPAKFLQISTDEVYGSLGPTGYFIEKTPLDPHSPYSASKASADLLVKSYYDTYGMPINITRCSNNYGPYQFPEKLIPLVIQRAISHKPIPVYGDGKQIRDWIFVEDHCKAIDLVFEKGKIGDVYNIGGHNEQENINIVKKIIEVLNDKINDEKINNSLIKHVKDRLGHDRRYAIDPTKIKNELSWEPEVIFDEGIKETTNWYLESNDWFERIITGEYIDFYKKNYEAR